MILIRWKKGESRRGREFTNKDVSIAGMICPCCQRSIGAVLGPYTLVAVGPVDEDDREDYEAGKYFSAGGVLMHTSCLDLLNDLELDKLCRELVIVPGPREEAL